MNIIRNASNHSRVGYKVKPIVFNYNLITGRGTPTRAARGAYQGFSLPVYNSDFEELYGCTTIDTQWDQVSNITCLVCGWLASANTDKKFNLEIGWAKYDPTINEVVPSTTANVPIETETGTAAQYTSFVVQFEIDVLSADVNIDQPLAFRLRRLAASGDEITGEFVVEGVGIKTPIN